MDAWARKHKAKYNVRWPIEDGSRPAHSTTRRTAARRREPHGLVRRHLIVSGLINRTLDDDPHLAKARKPSQDPMNHLYDPDDLRARRLKVLSDRLIEHLAKSYKTDPSAIPGIIAEGDRKGWAKRPLPGRPP